MELKTIQKRYNWYSNFYDKFEAPMEKMAFKLLRKRIMGSLQGKILEVGVGTGKNLPYYQSTTKVIGIDISTGMLSKATNRVKRLKLRNVELNLMNVENLLFEDNTFDTIVCTFVLCSVSDLIKAVMEMLRVLKPDGNIIMLEHVLSQMPLMALFQKLFNPFTRGKFGFNIDRNTVANVQKAGGILKKDKNLTKTDILKLVVFCKKDE
ncbi:MAG: class I SAM-dependent methyltransferase [Candidatus Hodarchaeales archaeon]